MITPIFVNNAAALALIDTGADVSILDLEFAKSQQLKLSNIDTRIRLVDGSFQTIVGVANFQLSVGDKVVDIPMRVMDLKSKNYHMILGLDLCPMFEIGINVPIRTEGDIPSNHDRFFDYNKRVGEIPPLTDAQALVSDNLKKAVQDLLNINIAIKLESVCNIRESLVCLPTVPGKIAYRYYPYKECHHKIIQDKFDQWWLSLYIKDAPVGCSWNSPLLVVPKKGPDGTYTGYRVCIDVRKLNEILEDDKFPLPRIRNILESLAGNLIFTVIDLKEGFHQFPVREEDQVKLTFTFNGRQFMFTRAPFGIKTLPSIFQRVMTKIFHNLSFVSVYIDDIIIASKTVEEHIQHVRIVLSRLNQANLRVGIDKCVFGVPCVCVLGHIVDANGISADETKISKVTQWKQPRSPKDLQSFLGLVNYFSEYIPFYSTLAAPLNKIRNNKKFEWDAEWTGNLLESFSKLKMALQNCTKISYPDFSRKFFIATDASKSGIGGVLYQLDKDNKKQFVLFFSRSLSKSELNYCVTKLELLGIIYALRRCSYYIYGRHFTLITDHKALTFLWTQKNLNSMLMRWYEELIVYDFDIIHCPGYKHILPDLLSRLYPSYALRTTKDDEPITLLHLLHEEEACL